MPWGEKIPLSQSSYHAIEEQPFPYKCRNYFRSEKKFLKIGYCWLGKDWAGLRDQHLFWLCLQQAYICVDKLRLWWLADIL